MTWLPSDECGYALPDGACRRPPGHHGIHSALVNKPRARRPKIRDDLDRPLTRRDALAVMQALSDIGSVLQEGALAEGMRLAWEQFTVQWRQEARRS